MDIWLVILYMVINQGYIIIVIFKFTFSYHFIETANLKSQLFHNKFFHRQVSLLYVRTATSKADDMSAFTLEERFLAAVRDGEQRQPVTEAFIRSARQHACDHLPFVRDAARPNAGVPTVRT